MEEVLNNTHDQENHGEGQTSDSQDTQEGQAGISSIEHGNQVGDSIRDPATDSIENLKNSIKNSSSSLQKPGDQAGFSNGCEIRNRT